MSNRSKSYSHSLLSIWRLLFAFLLRYFTLLWGYALIDLLVSQGEGTGLVYYVLGIVAFILLLTKADTKLLAVVFSHQLSRIVARVVNLLLWIWVVAKTLSPESIDPGLWTLYAQFVISPISTFIVLMIEIPTCYALLLVDLPCHTQVNSLSHLIQLAANCILSFAVLEKVLALLRRLPK